MIDSTKLQEWLWRIQSSGPYQHIEKKISNNDKAKDQLRHGQDLYNNGLYEDAYAKLQAIRIEDFFSDKWKLEVYCLAGDCALELKKYELAKEEYTRVIKIINQKVIRQKVARKGLFDDLSNNERRLYIGALYNRATCWHSLHNDREARKDWFLVKEWANVEKTSKGVGIKEEAKKYFENYEKTWLKFLNYDYSERKLLMPVAKYTTVAMSIVNVVQIVNLPTQITFFRGNLDDCQLYIGHPLLPHLYIPFDNYQFILIKEQLEELCLIAQSLGATDIAIDFTNIQSKDADMKAETNDCKKRQQLKDKLQQSIRRHQTFTPTKTPSLPEDLVWYNHEPSWQILYQQRMSGILTHTEHIETHKTQLVNNDELAQIKEDLKTQTISVGMKWEGSEKSKYEIQEDTILNVTITFAPLEQLPTK